MVIGLVLLWVLAGLSVLTGLTVLTGLGVLAVLPRLAVLVGLAVLSGRAVLGGLGTKLLRLPVARRSRWILLLIRLFGRLLVLRIRGGRVRGGLPRRVLGWLPLLPLLPRRSRRCHLGRLVRGLLIGLVAGRLPRLIRI